jgi:hypothetical protein
MFAPTVAALASVKHGCVEHVCACRARPRAATSAAPACHGQRKASPSDCDLRSRCAHEPPAMRPAEVYVTPAVASAAPGLAPMGVIPGHALRTLPGILPIDPPPPKAA